MAIQLETYKITIKASKTLDQYVSANTKGGWKKIPYIYKKTIFTINSVERENPSDKISTQGIEIFNTKTYTKAHSLLEFGMKRQGLYYASLQITNVKQIAQGSWSWPYEFVPGGLYSALI